MYAFEAKFHEVRLDVFLFAIGIYTSTADKRQMPTDKRRLQMFDFIVGRFLTMCESSKRQNS